MLSFIQKRTIQLNGSILGFEECNQFSIDVIEDNHEFAYLQSLEQEHVSFLVVSPFSFHPDYSIELEEKDRKALNIETHEDVVVLSIVTVSEPFPASTINLLAPVIFNIKNGQGKQIVLPPKYKYGTKEPLFEELHVESGE
ncbi:flagellar assembly protein FliW [Paenibacillus aestuarii]|uniref:Flagellar assembly factor FliW n=1 Tax=Paenibacillus aestuarii TaxID=516965 RepID=A0ABW0K5S6_9BACL|nr:flagellar assembly protein FliW [Paenibacillus aestuarii]